MDQKKKPATSSLRDEMFKEQKKQEAIIDDSALRWVYENVIPLNEKINRNAINRLINSISKFETTFGPYKSSIPSLAGILDSAEDNLNSVLTGRAGDKRAGDMLEYLSYIYNVFSGFFAKDLPLLMKTKIFAAPKEMSGMRMDSISLPGFKADTVRKALAHAITPSAEDKKLMSKILRSKNMPKMDAQKIAKEMMALSFNDLMKLTEVGRVPVVATGAPNQGKVEEPAEIVDESAGSMISEASMDDVGDMLKNLFQAVSKAGLAPLAGTIADLQSKLLEFMNSTAGEQMKGTLAQATGKSGALADLFKTPGGKLVKQGNMAIEVFTALGNAWPKVERFLQNTDATDADMANFKGIITKEISGGFFKKAAQAFGVTTQPYPGLETQTIVDSLTDSTLQTEQAEPEIVNPNAAQPNASDPNAVPDHAGSGVEKLKVAMTALHQFAQSKASSSPTSASTSAQTAQQGGTQTGGTTGTDGTAVSGNELVGGQAVTDIMKAAKLTDSTENRQVIDQVLVGLQKAGYKVGK